MRQQRELLLTLADRLAPVIAAAIVKGRASDLERIAQLDKRIADLESDKALVLVRSLEQTVAEQSDRIKKAQEEIADLISRLTTPSEVKAMVSEAVAALPPAPAGTDGKDGAPGRDGIDGKDGAPGRDGSDGVAGRDGIDGKDGAPGRDGIDGKDGAAGINGEPGVDGKDGLDGKDGRDGVDGEPGVDGKDGAPGVDGKDGAPGVDGAKGEPGRDGKDGAPGIDGAKGEQGRDGTAGRDGLPGRDGKDGAPGVDGLGFDDMDIVHDGLRNLKFRLVRGDVVKEFPFVMPVVIDRGVFKEGTDYAFGDAVSFGGSLWIAQKSTADRPGTSDAWRLAVKKGRDGKDGEAPKPPAKVKL